MPVGKRMKTQGPAAVFVTTTVTDWAPVFSMESAAIIMIEQLRRTSRFYYVAIIGYVVMPSHIHVLVGLSDVAKLSRYVQSLKSLSSRRVKEINLGAYRRRLIPKSHFHLWKRRFDDLVIYSEKQLNIKLEYMHNNPVRDGLVDDPIKWKYSSAVDWLTDRKGIIGISRDYSWLNLS